jgi:phosphoserine phosphatase
MRMSEIVAVCFDVDGTLVQRTDGKTIWEAVHEFLGAAGPLNRQRLEAFRTGRIEYEEWVALDVGDWQRLGLTRADLERIVGDSMEVTQGARETIATLVERGYEVSIVSGSISVVVEQLLHGLPFHDVFVNRIDFDAEGGIAGWRATPHDFHGKALAIDRVAGSLGVDASRIAFVGDHWNDLPAMEKAGFSIAFAPKDDRLRQVADAVVEQPPMTQVLGWFPRRGRKQ